MAATTQAAPGATQGRDLDAGRMIAGLGALLLLISLFLDWYGESQTFDSQAAGEAGLTAWTSFELIDILLAALAIATLAWAIEAALARSARSRLPPQLGRVAGPVGLALVLVAAINAPPTVSVFDPSREIGVWIALAGALLMTIGALLATARISLVVEPRSGASENPSVSGRPTAHDPAFPETETRPLTHEPGLQPPPR